MAKLFENTLSDQEKAKKIVQALISDTDDSWNSISYLDRFNLFYLSPATSLSKQIRFAFQDELIAMKETLTKDASEPNKNKLARIICLLPYANIKPLSKYKIPTLIQSIQSSNQWKLVEFKVEAIELTPQHGFERLVINDYDRIFAYGLTPTSNTEEELDKHLIFMNPKYPAQQGYLNQIFFNYQSSSWAYSQWKNRISSWILEAKHKVKIYSADYANGITDEVKKDSTIKDKVSDTFKYPEIETNNPRNESLNNNWLTDFLKKIYIANILDDLFNGLIVYPCHYLVIPVCREILQHKFELTLVCMMTMIFVMMPGLIMTAAGVTVTTLAVAYFATKLIEPLKIILNLNEKNPANCHTVDNNEQDEWNNKFALVL
ncbi:MAG: hypothetical protein A3E88_00080 [Legionellales bacterium RIFCSPHIGHO2_12_FULL_35_11]|nr:MAG: hypothetical protein A3E88_00080 [Legionellales bacterium RIFCSPHIGHO2_12_FULL_35_11]